MITMIVAHDSEGNIGKEGGLPWGKLPNDLAYFKSETIGNIVVMGRKTYESIGKPLPNRKNFVLTRNEDAFRQAHPNANVTVLTSVDDVITINGFLKEKVYVIGGAEIYAAMFPHARRVLYTEVHGKFEGCDAKFPDPALYGNWQEKFIGYLPADEDNAYAVSFHELVREDKPWESKLYHRFI